jgi:hypothetical protein
MTGKEVTMMCPRGTKLNRRYTTGTIRNLKQTSMFRALWDFIVFLK